MRSIPLVVVLHCSNIVAYAKAPASLPPQSRFEITGDCDGSTAGHAPVRGTLYSKSPKAEAMWHPAIQSTWPVRVSFWVSPHLGNTPAARLEIGRANQVVVTREINLQLSPPRWETIGLFLFDGSGSEFIRLTKTKNGNLRASGVKLDILDSPAPIEAWLAADGNLTSEPSNHFRPSEQIPTNHFLGALCKILGNPDIADNDHQTIRKHAMANGWFIQQPSDLLQLRDAFFILVNAAKKSGRPLDWIKPRPPKQEVKVWAEALGFSIGTQDPAIPQNTRTVTRAQAAWLLARFQSNIIHAGPPGSGWKLTFSDDFDSPIMNYLFWKVSNKETWAKLMSIRMTGNVVQENDGLRLITRKEKVGDKKWTTDMNGTEKNLCQFYGSWEARMRYAAAPIRAWTWTGSAYGNNPEPILHR